MIDFEQDRWVGAMAEPRLSTLDLPLPDQGKAIWSTLARIKPIIRVHLLPLTTPMKQLRPRPQRHMRAASRQTHTTLPKPQFDPSSLHLVRLRIPPQPPPALQ